MIAQKISYNIIFVSLSKLISIGLALYAIKLLSGHLGVEGFGSYAIALAYLGFLMSIGDMGLHGVMTREISRKGADENDIVNKIFSLRLVITMVIFVCASILVWTLPYEPDTKKAIFIIAGAFMFSSSYSLLNGVFQKHITMYRVALVELLGKVIQMSIIIALVRMDLSFIFSVIAIFVAMMSNFVLIFLLVRKYVRIRLVWDTAYWREFLQKSLPLGISAFATFLYFKVDTILLSFLQTTTDVGIYSAAYKIIETLIFFPAMVIGLIFPLLSRYIFTDEKAFHETTTTTIKFFVLMLIPAVVSLEFLSPWIIDVINGEDFEQSKTVLRVISVSLIGIFFGHLFMTVATAANLQKLLMKVLLVTAALNIALNVILIPQFSYMGAAYSSVATEVFVMSVVLYIITTRTAFRFTLQKPMLYVLAAAVMISANVILPLHVVANALIATVLYAVVLFGARVITIDDLRHIRPSVKGGHKSI